MRVEVYRNLLTKTWSVRECSTGLVVSHPTFVVVKSPRFVVQQGGRKRVLKEQSKNVHAFVRGELVDEELQEYRHWKQATYNPYKYESFVNLETEEAVTEAAWVVMDGSAVYYSTIEEGR